MKKGKENITEKIPSTDFIQDKFGVKLPSSSLVIEVGYGTASNLLSLSQKGKVGARETCCLKKRNESNLRNFGSLTLNVDISDDFKNSRKDSLCDIYIKENTL